MAALARNLTANGDTAMVVPERNVNAHALYFDIWGTFGGATVKLQQSPDFGTTWIDVASGSFTSNGFLAVDMPTRGFRLNVASASGTTDVSAEIA